MDSVHITIWQILTLEWLSVFVRLAVLSGLAYLIFYKWAYKKFAKYCLYKIVPSKRDVRREIFYSFLTTLFSLPITLVAIYAYLHGATQIYLNVSDYGWLWYFISFVLCLLLHDAYFYWTHRWMHHPKLFASFHRIHHISKKPTPFAVYAFHPLEAMVQSLFFGIIGFIMPVHVSLFVIFGVFSIVLNIYSHLGFNFLSEEKINSYPFKILSHPGNHSWHHQHINGNYTFYFQFWDRVMGTYKGSLKSID